MVKVSYRITKHDRIKIETYWNVNVTLAVAGVTALTALK